MATIKKDLKVIRYVLMDELKLLRKGKVTNQRAREVCRITNQAVLAIRTETKVLKCL